MNLIKRSSCNSMMKNIKAPNRKTYGHGLRTVINYSSCDILICFEINHLNMPAYKLHQQKFYYSETMYAL